MSSKKEFQHYITNEDRIDMEFTLQRGTVVGFAVNYRAQIQGKWHEVYRYDTEHGTLHVHRFWRKPGAQKEDLKQPVVAAKDYGVALTTAEEDIKANWQTYRKRMEATVHE